MLSSWQLASLVCALAQLQLQLGRLSPKFSRRLLVRILQRMDEFTDQGLASVLWGVARCEIHARFAPAVAATWAPASHCVMQALWAERVRKVGGRSAPAGGWLANWAGGLRVPYVIVPASTLPS